MFSRFAQGSRGRRLLAAVAISAIWLGVHNPCRAQSPSSIVRVEEDWELVVGNPDPAIDAPQVTCAISPTSDVNGLHAAIELNYRSQPSFSPGGLQLQVWNGEQLITAKSYTNNATLSTAGETIRWTQTISLSGTNVTFEVLSGSSSTWGSFGGQGYLKAIVQTTLPDLNGYRASVSLQNSGIGFASNRVQSLVLREVRLITASGDVLRDSTPKTLHQQ